MNERNAWKLISADKRFVWHSFTGVVAAAVCAAARTQALLNRPFGNGAALETPLYTATKAVVLRLGIGDLWNLFVVAAQKDAEEITP